MPDGAFPWLSTREVEDREALANQVRNEMYSLLSHPGWKRLVVELDKRKAKELEGLCSSEVGAERRRGIIAAFAVIKNMPVAVDEAAVAELTKYEGQN